MTRAEQTRETENNIMSEQDEIKQEEPTTPAVGEPPEETVGDIMDKAKGEGLKWFVIVVSAAVYLASIVYAEVHGITMLQKGVAPDMRFWAGMGMIAAGVSAVLFPIALKVWAIEARHRLVATLFYVADFAFLAFNAFTDFNTNAGQALAPWAQTYVTYILPASPVIVGAMWAILWELDPGVRQKILQLTLRAAMKEKMARKVADAARGANVTATIDAAAAQEVDRALFELFGAKPAKGYYVMDGQPQRRTAAQSFFDGLFSLAQRALSSVTGTQSQPSDSSQQDEPTQPPQA
jgi:hypothetical protein